MVFVPSNQSGKQRSGGMSSLEQQLNQLSAVAENFRPDQIAGFTPANLSGFERTPGWSQWGSQNISEDQVQGEPGFWMEASSLMGQTAKATSQITSGLKKIERSDELADEKTLEAIGTEAKDYLEEMARLREQGVLDAAESGTLTLDPVRVQEIIKGEGNPLTPEEIYVILNPGTTLEEATDLLQQDPEALTEFFHNRATVSGTPHAMVTDAWNFKKQSEHIRGLYDGVRDKLRSKRGAQLLEEGKLQDEILNGNLRIGASNFRAYITNLVERLKDDPDITPEAMDSIVQKTVDAFYQINPELGASGELVSIINNTLSQGVAHVESEIADDINGWLNELDTLGIPKLVIDELYKGISSGDFTPEWLTSQGIYLRDEDGNPTTNIDRNRLLDLATDIILGSAPPEPEGYPQESLERIKQQLPEGVEAAGSLAESRALSVRRLLSRDMLLHEQIRSEMNRASTNAAQLSTIQLDAVNFDLDNASWTERTISASNAMNSNQFRSIEDRNQQHANRINGLGTSVLARAQATWNHSASRGLPTADRMDAITNAENGILNTKLLEHMAEVALQHSGALIGPGMTDQKQKEAISAKAAQLRTALSRQIFQTILKDEVESAATSVDQVLRNDLALLETVANLPTTFAAAPLLLDTSGFSDYLSGLVQISEQLGMPTGVPEKTEIQVPLADGTLHTVEVTISSSTASLVVPWDERHSPAAQTLIERDGVGNNLLAWEVTGYYDDPNNPGTVTPHVMYLPVNPDTAAWNAFNQGIQSISRSLQGLQSSARSNGVGALASGLGGVPTRKANPSPTNVQNVHASMAVDLDTLNELDQYFQSDEANQAAQLPPGHPDRVDYDEAVSARAAVEAQLAIALNVLHDTFSGPINPSTSMFSQAELAYRTGNVSATTLFMSTLARIPGPNRRSIISVMAESPDENFQRFAFFTEKYLDTFYADPATAQAVADLLDPDVPAEDKNPLALLDITTLNPNLNAGDVFNTSHMHAQEQLEISKRSRDNKALIEFLSTGRNTSWDSTSSRKREAIPESVVGGYSSNDERRRYFRDILDPGADALATALGNQFVQYLPVDEDGQPISISGWEDFHTYFDASGEIEFLFREGMNHYVGSYLASQDPGDAVTLKLWAEEQASQFANRGYRFYADAQGNIGFAHDPAGRLDYSHLFPNSKGSTPHISLGQLATLQMRSTPMTHAWTAQDIDDDHRNVGYQLQEILAANDPNVVNSTINSVYQGIVLAMHDDRALNRDAITSAETYHGRRWYSHPLIQSFIAEYEDVADTDGISNEEKMARLTPYLKAMSMDWMDNGEFWVKNPDGHEYYTGTEHGDWEAFTDDIRTQGYTNWAANNPNQTPHFFIPGKLDIKSGQWDAMPNATSLDTGDWTVRDAVDMVAGMAGTPYLDLGFYRMLGSPEMTQEWAMMYGVATYRGDLDQVDYAEGALGGHFPLLEASVPPTRDSLNVTLRTVGDTRQEDWLHHRPPNMSDAQWARIDGLPINEWFLDRDNVGMNEYASKDEVIAGATTRKEIRRDPITGDLTVHETNYPFFALNAQKIDPNLTLAYNTREDFVNAGNPPMTFHITHLMDASGWHKYTNYAQTHTFPLPEFLINPSTEDERELSNAFFAGKQAITLNHYFMTGTADAQRATEVSEVATRNNYVNYRDQPSSWSGYGEGRMGTDDFTPTYDLMWNPTTGQPVLFQNNGFHFKWSMPLFSALSDGLTRATAGDKANHQSYGYHPLPYYADDSGSAWHNMGGWFDYLDPKRYPDFGQWRADVAREANRFPGNVPEFNPADW